ncbi:hypothetical protein P8629_06545 [Hydrogenovibrio sp. 3SP14C1]|uniref:hypothetical protein n=1 Tax=Hydrogenovibrio sp. 3SP14C1 TaxID=3038774 RepID=UPI0024180EE2|nr:hypothetical protein [Hydrogenovibrio sp. 3SP14C1]MDG4812663.1 hypothetical protein [Hydrogenovibrio sp. 3SP14C1]
MATITPQNDSVNYAQNHDRKSAQALDEALKARQRTESVAVQDKDLPSAQTASDFYSPTTKGMQAASAVEKFQQSYQYSQTMTMKLQTQEGDVVQVDFRQLYAQYQSYKQEQSMQEGPKGARYFESTQAMEATAFQERFGFSVKGNLNEGELKAVYDVFEKVDKLASEFFNGDIEKAFEKAQSLEIDFGQIKSFNLNLHKSESATMAYQQAEAYKATKQQADEPSEETKGQIAQLPAYLQNWQNIVEKMNEKFVNARETFDRLLAGTTAQRAGDESNFSTWYDRVKSFHDRLAEAAGLDKKSLKPSGVEVEPLIHSNDVEGTSNEATTEEENSSSKT